MDPLRAIVERHGVFLTREAEYFGYDDRSIARAVRHGVWHRVRRGAYVFADDWSEQGAETRHLVTAAAVHRSYGDRVAFSHTTAALMHGVSVWGMDLRRIHVTRLDAGAGRTERDVVHHEAFALAPGDLVSLDGRIVTNPARAAVETGLLGTTEQALVSLDSMLHRGLASSTDLGDVFDVVQHWPGAQHLQVAVRMADGRSESAGESRARWLFFSQGLPAPDLQFEVRDEDGRLLGTSDFAWPAHRTLGEFDGKVKYGRLLKPGQSPTDVVFTEKRREDLLRRTTGYGMVRLAWDDYTRPAATAQWLRSYLDPAA